LDLGVITIWHVICTRNAATAPETPLRLVTQKPPVRERPPRDSCAARRKKEKEEKRGGYNKEGRAEEGAGRVKRGASKRESA